MTNGWQALTVDRLLDTLELKLKLEVLEKYSRDRDLSDEEIQDMKVAKELCRNYDALRIKFS